MIPLNQMHIPAPCHEDWEGMTGDQRRRFCAGCGCHVHDLSALTRAQVQTLLDQAEGRVCVRFTQRPDGSPQTLDDLTPPPARRSWLPARRLAAAVSWLAALTLAALGAGVRAAVPPRHAVHPGKPHAIAHPRPRPLMGKIAPRRPITVPPPVVMGAPPPILQGGVSPPPRSQPTMGIVGPSRAHMPAPPKP